MKHRKCISITLALVFFAVQPLFTGRIIGVPDGDTVTLLTALKKEVKIRLYGVDCPEKSQAFGQWAKQFSSEMIFGKDEN